MKPAGGETNTTSWRCSTGEHVVCRRTFVPKSSTKSPRHTQDLQKANEEREGESEERGEGEGGRPVAQVIVALAHVDDVVVRSLLVTLAVISPLVATVTGDADLFILVDWKIKAKD